MLSETALHQAQHRAPVRAGLRRYRWSALLAAIVIATVSFGSWRLSGDENGAAEPGMRSTASISTEGSLDIVQRLTFATARSSLTMSIPVRTAPSDQFDPRIDKLRLRVDGRAARGLTGPLGKGETHTFKFPEPAKSAVLMYSVKGAIAKTRPSVPGRALALVTPVTIEGLASLASRIEVDGQGVLNLGCVAAGAQMTTCGTHVGRRWVVERIADDPVVDVVAQVNLPAATQP